MDFGPAGAGTQKGKGTLGIMVTTDRLKQDPGFAHTSVQGFAPFPRADGRTKKFDVANGYRCAALEIVRCEVLDGRASRGHLGLVARFPAQSPREEAPG